MSEFVINLLCPTKPNCNYVRIKKNECVKIIGFKTFVNQQKHCMNEIVSSVEIIEHKLKMSFHINVMKQIKIYAAV